MVKLRERAYNARIRADTLNAGVAIRYAKLSAKSKFLAITIKNLPKFPVRRVGQRFTTNFVAKLVWLVANMQLIAEHSSRFVFRDLAVIFYNDFRGMVPPIVMRIRIEKGDGSIWQQSKTMLNKPGCRRNCSQNR